MSRYLMQFPLVRKTLSVLALLFGTVLIHAVLLSAVSSAIHHQKDGVFWLLNLLAFAVGAGIVWGAATLWEHWRTAWGIMILLAALWTTWQAVNMRRFVPPPEARAGAGPHLTTINAFVIVAAVLALLGLALVAYQRNRRTLPKAHDQAS